MRTRLGRRWGRTLGAALVCTVLAWTAWAEGEGIGRLREPGEKLPTFALKDLNGSMHDLAAELGKGPVVVFFWSVFCPNCKDSMPGLAELYQEWKGKGMVVWAVSVDPEDFSNAVRAYAQDMKLPFPVMRERLEGEYLVAADALGVSKTPTFYLADRGGTILARQVVDIDYDAVRRILSAQGR